MGRKNETLRFTVLSFFVAIELIMAFTPIGYINIGVISITLMHLPVILAGILLGRKEGLLIGLVFGLSSIIIATTQPTITSFCFTPFYSVGNIHGNIWSLVVSLVPRMALGWFAGFLFTLGKDRFKEWSWISIISFLCTLGHTISVLGLIWLFFGNDFMAVTKMSVGVVLGSVLVSNGLVEMVLADRKSVV